jgi:hypothetical protein
MITAKSKNGIDRLLVYHAVIMTVEKEDSLQVSIDNEYLKYVLEFTFSNEGEKYSTTYWEKAEANYLKYQLNKWDSTTWVENIKPVILKVNGSNEKFWLKFRNQSNENKEFRHFELSVWKEVTNG